MPEPSRDARSSGWNEFLLIVASFAWLFVMPWIAHRGGWWAGEPVRSVMAIGGMILPLLVPLWILRVALIRKFRWAFVASSLVLLMYVLTIFLPFLWI